MADQDDFFYLQPGYDISSLTIPRIRSILVAHDVAYPSSAKKQDLLDILRQEVISKSKRLLAAQARVKRTSRGITDMPSSQDDMTEEDSQHMPPPPAPKTPRSRKSRSTLTEEELATPRTSRKSRTPSQRKSAIERPSESETDNAKPSSSHRSPRKSIASSSSRFRKVKPEDDNPNSRRSVTAGASPFSDDNPFQSGSSPPSDSRTSQSRSRKSLGQSTKTGSPEIKREDIEHIRSTYEIPVARIGVDDNGVEATEEFTNEATNELQRDIAANKQLARHRKSALVRHQRKPISTAAKTAPAFILFSVLTAIGAWYRQEKINIGYCGVGESSWSLASNPNIPIWVHDNLQPQCEPCPAHADCYPTMSVKCNQDFVLQPHPLHLKGLIPFPPTCEPDSEKERKIKAVADRAVEELRQRRADFECGGSREGPSEQTIAESTTVQVQQKLEIPEETLKQEVSKMRRKGMTSEEFEELWRGALGDVIDREEVDVVRDGSGGISLSSSSFANLPFKCAIRKSVLRAISRNRVPLAILSAAAILLGYARYRVNEYTKAKAQIPGLVSMTLDRLATQAALQLDGRVQEAFISIGQLRDDVLRNVFSVQERERVWQRVRKIVEGNANVRAGSREGGKTGEWSRVWEWIGPVEVAHEGRRSIGTAEQDNSALRSWNEGHAIY